MMKSNTLFLLFYAIFFLLVACAGTEITDRYVNQEFLQKPVSDILVIVVADKVDIRKSFEKRFVDLVKWQKNA